MFLESRKNVFQTEFSALTSKACYPYQKPLLGEAGRFPVQNSPLVLVVQLVQQGLAPQQLPCV